MRGLCCEAAFQLNIHMTNGYVKFIGYKSRSKRYLTIQANVSSHLASKSNYGVSHTEYVFQSTHIEHRTLHAAFLMVHFINS